MLAGEIVGYVSLTAGLARIIGWGTTPTLLMAAVAILLIATGGISLP